MENGPLITSGPSFAGRTAAIPSALSLVFPTLAQDARDILHELHNGSRLDACWRRVYHKERYLYGEAA